jgi:predicted PurR-regulated permease PerM
MTSLPDHTVGAATDEPAPVEEPIGEPGQDPDATSPDAEAPGTARVEPVVVPRWVQAVVVAVALFALAGLARAAAPVLLLFLIAAVVALIINPLVTRLQGRWMPRGVAIAVVFAGFIAAMAGIVALLVRPVARQVAAFQDDLPRWIGSANTSLARVQEWLDERGISVQIKRPGETGLETLQASVMSGSGDVVEFTRDLVTLVAEAGLVLILILVIAVYMLLYGERIGALARRLMPPGNGTLDDDYPVRVQRAVFGYVRGQLLFSFIMGLSAGVALWLFGVLGIFPPGRTYAVFFGVFYGLMELIPYLGPVLGAAPAILVALFQGEPLTALWLGLLFVALQQVEGHVVAPLVFAHSLRINPLLVILALLLGGHLQGIPGALLALPLAAIARETLIYLRRHLVMEPWGTPTAAALRARPTERPGPAPRVDARKTAWSVRLAAGTRDRWVSRRGGATALPEPDDAAAPQDLPRASG